MVSAERPRQQKAEIRFSEKIMLKQADRWRNG